MKKFFAILIVALLATSYAFSNNVASGTSQVNVTVVEQLSITPGDDVILGYIGKGDTKTIAEKVEFTFTGSNLLPWKFKVEVAKTGSGDANLDIPSGVTAGTEYPIAAGVIGSGFKNTISFTTLTGVTEGPVVWTFTATAWYTY